MSKRTDKSIDNMRSLTEKELERIERACSAMERRFEAEAKKESQLKMRILFERAAADALPFIIYCITMSAVAAYSLFKIMDLQDTTKFYAGLGGLVLIMILPLLILPKLPLIGWLTKLRQGKNQVMPEAEIDDADETSE